MAKPTSAEKLEFTSKIEALMTEKELTVMDAILHYCRTNDTEIELAATLITDKLKLKLKIEAENLNFLPKSNRLEC